MSNTNDLDRVYFLEKVFVNFNNSTKFITTQQNDPNKDNDINYDSDTEYESEEDYDSEYGYDEYDTEYIYGTEEEECFAFTTEIKKQKQMLITWKLRTNN